MSAKSNIRKKTVALCQIAACAALLCVLSPLSVPTPFGVGFTLQVLIVILVALVLKPLYAVTAQVIYTLLGIIGLPVFAGYQSGFGVLAGPTGGFLIGYRRLHARDGKGFSCGVLSCRRDVHPGRSDQMRRRRAAFRSPRTRPALISQN